MNGNKSVFQSRYGVCWNSAMQKIQDPSKEGFVSPAASAFIAKVKSPTFIPLEGAVLLA